jgi:hypothetical protein
VREVFIEGAEHTYPLITDRLRLFELIGAWMKEVFSDRLAAPAEPTGLSASPPDAVSAGAATTGNSVSG